MRRILLAAVMFGAAFGAQAADMPEFLRGGFVSAGAHSTRNWEGWYAGGQVSYSSAHEDFTGSTVSLTYSIFRNSVLQDPASQFNVLPRLNVESAPASAPSSDATTNGKISFSASRPITTTSTISPPRLAVRPGHPSPPGSNPPPGHAYTYNVTLAANAALQVLVRRGGSFGSFDRGQRRSESRCQYEDHGELTRPGPAKGDASQHGLQPHDGTLETAPGPGQDALLPSGGWWHPGLRGRASARSGRRATRTCRARPPPGGVDDEHRYTPGTGVRHGSSPRVGRRTNWTRSATPALMSPPTKLALRASMSLGAHGVAGRIRSRKPGAKRSICASMRSVMSTVEPLGTWQ